MKKLKLSLLTLLLLVSSTILSQSYSLNFNHIHVRDLVNQNNLDLEIDVDVVLNMADRTLTMELWETEVFQCDVITTVAGKGPVRLQIVGYARDYNDKKFKIEVDIYREYDFTTLTINHKAVQHYYRGEVINITN